MRLRNITVTPQHPTNHHKLDCCYSLIVPVWAFVTDQLTLSPAVTTHSPADKHRY